MNRGYFRKHSTGLALAGIVLVALGFRIFLFRFRYAIGFDEPHYLQLAASAVLNGFKNILHPHWSPMYPSLIAVMSLLVKDFELAGRLVSAISGSLVVLPAFFLTQELFNRKTAYFIAVLIALYPPLAFISTSVLTESVYILLSISGVTIGWFALKKHSIIMGLITGVLFGMSYLTRPDGIGYLIVFLCVGIVLVLYNIFSKAKKARLIVILLVSTIVFLAISSPYLIYLRKTVGKWTLSLKWETARYDIGSLRKLSEDNKFLPVDMGWHIGNFHLLKSTQKRVDSFSGSFLFKRVAKNYYDLIKTAIPRVLTGSLFILLILGIFGDPLQKEKLKCSVYLISYILFFWFALIPFFMPLERYMLPILPICFVWIGNGINVLYRWLISSFRSLFVNWPEFLEKANGISVLLIVIFLLFFSYLPELGKIINRDKYSTDPWADAIEQKKAGLWLKEHTDKPPIIMCQNHSIDFYAGNYNVRQSTNIPRNKLSRILEYAKYRGVEYIVLNERYLENYYPHLSFLLEGKNVPPNLKLVYEDIEKNGLKTVIYKLLK